MNEAFLTIGKLGERANVNIETLRYYERQGLLPPPQRSAANYRLFPPETIEVVRFIKQAQKLGFSLTEIKELLSLQAIPEAQCADIRNIAQEKIRNIDTKIATLQTIRNVLATLLIECTGEAPIQQCPILETIAAED